MRQGRGSHGFCMTPNFLRWTFGALEQTSPLNVRRIGGVTMAENHSPTRPPITRKPHRCQADEDLVARFICHVNSTHVLQSLWRGLPRSCAVCFPVPIHRSA